MERKIRTAIYSSVSTSDGRQEAENQLAQLRQFAESQTWETAAEYIDHDSGGRADRAEVRRMFADSVQRRFDLVLVWALERFTREGVAETFEYIKRLNSQGVQFVSFTEEHFRTTGPAGELMIAVAAWIGVDRQTGADQNLRTGSGGVKSGDRARSPVGEAHW